MLEGDLIQNDTDKYNNMVAENQWNKTDPKDAKIIALKTRMFKLEVNICPYKSSRSRS